MVGRASQRWIGAALLLGAAAACNPTPAANGVAPGAVTVPFVACKLGARQVMGPLAGQPHPVALNQATAAQLAYYSNGQPGQGVLGPRGWYCFSGSTAIIWDITVQQDPAENFGPSGHVWVEGSGVAIVARGEAPDPTTQFDVASLVARVFPQHMDFVQALGQGSRPPMTFETGPYPTDRIANVSPTVVEYETPPTMMAIGLGTVFGNLTAGSAGPIAGAAILQGAGMNLGYNFVAVRLPTGQLALTGPVIHQFEADASATGR